MTKDIVESYFTKNYHSIPYIIKSPGRINIIGEHTDYNNGFVLPASIEKSIYFALQKNGSTYFQIEACLDQPEKIQLHINGTENIFKSFWGNYFQTILHLLIEKKYPVQGLNCVFGGDIPIGFGLSSSAALCCGFTYAVSIALDLQIQKQQIALIAQEAEHRIGLQCGLMDQYAVLFGKKTKALFLDCKNLNFDYVPIKLKGYSWVLINSNIKHKLAENSEYNARRKSCEKAVCELQESNKNITSLRNANMEDLDLIKDRISSTDVKRAQHVVQENTRVLEMVEALSIGKAEKVGSLLYESHQSLSDNYEVSTKELDMLVHFTKKHEGILGSRMMGGGFGGCTINLIKDQNVKLATTEIIRDYHLATGIKATYYPVTIGNGVELL